MLPTIESELTRWLRSEVTVKISGVGEANANGLFDRLEDPVTIPHPDVGDDQGWLIWENKAALCSVMTALGSEVGENPEPRSFSPHRIWPGHRPLDHLLALHW